MEIKAILEYPYTQEAKSDFIIIQNHQRGYEIRQIEREIEEEIEVLEWDIIEVEETRPKYDEEGNPITHKEVLENPIYDEEGKIIGYNEPTEIDVQETETVTIEKQVPRMVEEPVIDPETGEPMIDPETGEIITHEVQAHHTETITKTVIDLQAWGYTNEEIFSKAKEEKINENTLKAKEAVESGYVLFKEAEFETNTQTCSDLTSTMLLMQAAGIETYEWLSKDDKVVTLTLEDFATLGGIIATCKNSIWNTKYLNYKTAIEEATTIEELNEIVIDYTTNEEEENVL